MRTKERIPSNVYDQVVEYLEFYFKCSTADNQETALADCKMSRQSLYRYFRGITENSTDNYYRALFLTEKLKQLDIKSKQHQYEPEQPYKFGRYA